MTRRACRRMVWLVLAVALAACRTRQPVGTLQESIDAQLAANAQRYGIPGQAVLILRDGEVVYRGTHGWADPDRKDPVRPETVFAAFSVSKLFTSILVLQLVEQGQLEPSAPIGRYLPDLPPRWRSVTVDEVLNHTSGLPDYFDPARVPMRLAPTREAAFRELADQPLSFEPGTEYQYNQVNYIILGAILEAHYRRPYRAIVTDRIVTPLQLKSTYLGKDHVPVPFARTYKGQDDRLVPDPVIDWPDYAIAHAELYSTIDDLGAFLTAVSEGRLVARETLLERWVPHRLRSGDTLSVAAGWDHGISGRYRQVGHDGGVKVRVRLQFADSLAQGTYVCIYLTNGSATNVWTRTLVDSVMAIALPAP